MLEKIRTKFGMIKNILMDKPIMYKINFENGTAKIYEKGTMIVDCKFVGEVDSPEPMKMDDCNILIKDVESKNSDNEPSKWGI